MRDKFETINSTDSIRFLWNIPSKLEKIFKPINKFLTKHGLILSDLGELDLTYIHDENIKKKILKDYDLFKYSLMLKDLDYGYPHR